MGRSCDLPGTDGGPYLNGGINDKSNGKAENSMVHAEVGSGGGWNLMGARRSRSTMFQNAYNSNSISTRIQDMFYQSRQIRAHHTSNPTLKRFKQQSLQQLPLFQQWQFPLLMLHLLLFQVGLHCLLPKFCHLLEFSVSGQTAINSVKHQRRKSQKI